MRKRIFGLSVSQKTLLLLILFIMIPLMVIGWLITSWISRQEIQAERDISMQRLYSISENIASQLDTVKRISNTLSVDTNINDVAKNREASLKHYAANEVMRGLLEYNDSIIKVQILSDGKVNWQFSKKHGYAFPEYGNEDFAEIIKQQRNFSFWSPAHPLFQMERGRYTKEVWVTSFYNGIYETKTMHQSGVLALHVPEDFLCGIYQEFLYGKPVAAWLVSKDGRLLSSTEKEWLSDGLPEDFQIDAALEAGFKDISRQEGNMQLLWQRCGENDCYLVQLNRETSALRRFEGFVFISSIFFIILYVGYMYFYRIFVIHPLSSLIKQMERAKNLELQQEALPAKGDEIGLLTITFQSMLSRIDELIGKVYVEKIKTQEAEREVMLSQINPHFLYNTLDSIRWNALSHGDREVGKQLEALSLMLRNNLNFGEMETTIKHEIQTIESYCYLLQARFRKEIEIEIQVDDLVAEHSIPKLLIQPLVENAYKHGLENKVGLKRIWLRVRKVKNKIVIRVADNGVGCDRNFILEQMASEDGRACFALKNIRDRIKLCYGTAGSFHFFSRPDVGTIVKIVLPLEIDIPKADIINEKKDD